MNYVANRVSFIEYIYICRAIFHATAKDGRSLPIFNCIAAQA
ncbi:RAxF-45 family protein [Fictibacillus macauensis]|nr:RAxF-45 family protein [Fictibacillus macauensis]